MITILAHQLDGGRKNPVSRCTLLPASAAFGLIFTYLGCVEIFETGHAIACRLKARQVKVSERLLKNKKDQCRPLAGVYQVGKTLPGETLGELVSLFSKTLSSSGR